MPNEIAGSSREVERELRRIGMRMSEEPLTKVTLNLFAKDVELLKCWFEHRGHYTEEIRWIVRDYVNRQVEWEANDE